MNRSDAMFVFLATLMLGACLAGLAALVSFIDEDLIPAIMLTFLGIAFAGIVFDTRRS